MTFAEFAGNILIHNLWVIDYMLIGYSGEPNRESPPVKANPKAMVNAIQYVFCQLLVWVVSKQYMPLVQTRLKG